MSSAICSENRRPAVVFALHESLANSGLGANWLGACRGRAELSSSAASASEISSEERERLKQRQWDGLEEEA